MLHREIPFLRICVPLCTGIVTGLYFRPGILFISLFSAVIILQFLAATRFNKYQDNFLFGIPLSLGLYLLGLVLYNQEKSSLSVLESEPSVFFCTLSDYPEEKANSFLLTLKLHSKLEESVSKPLHGSILIYHRKGSGMPRFTPGDRLVISCTPAGIMNRGNPYEFDYKFYMENHGIRYYSFTDNPDILLHDTKASRNLKHKALIIRHKIIEMYRNRGISDERLPLVSALTLGEKSQLDEDQKENFIKAGVMHIMAVSGLHAVILSMFVLNVLFFMKRKLNILRVTIAVLLLWLFAFVTGLTPSVLRATIMFSFIQTGSLMHRKVNGINSVLASAFVLILARPSVIFDAGFLLSYSAVIFIIAFYQDLYTRLRPTHKITDWIWQSVVITIVAQLGTLPLTIMLFNRFPAWFLLTNVIIVPLSSLAIILGCIIPILYPLKFLSGLIGLALDRLTWLTEFLTGKAASLPHSTIGNIGMTVPECILLFISIFTLLIFILKKQPVPVFWPITGIILYTAAGMVTAISVKTTDQLIVYNTPGFNNIGIRTGNRMLVFSDTLAVHREVARHCSTLGIKHSINLINEPRCISAGGKHILICRNPSIEILNYYKPRIIVLTGSSGIIQLKNFSGEVILASGTSFTFRLNESSFPLLHQVRKSGAYVATL